MEQQQHSILFRLRPYFFISLLALVACLPVSSLMFSLKNDVLAIEFPVQHFISEAIRHGENPVWFNSWCMGFPLQSILTWSVFSTPRTLLAALLPSDLVVLHIEFLLYVMSSGWVMFALLRKHFATERNLALLLACCYMLSGFTVGSAQWLLYITGLTFIPLLIYSTLCLVRTPSARAATGFAVSFYLLLTNVHIYLTVFAAYFLLFWFGIRFAKSLFRDKGGSQDTKRLFLWSFVAFLLTVLLCLAPAYYTYELVGWLERSAPLQDNTAFFRSNYLHPAGLQSLLLPLSTIRASYFNTEGSVLDTYTGLLPLLILFPSWLQNARNRDSGAWGLFLLAVFFLLLSLGHFTPFRSWINILPGLSFFRHPGVLRCFFIMALVIYLGHSFRGKSLTGIFTQYSKQLKWLTGLLIMITLFLVIWHSGSAASAWKGSFADSTRGLQNSQFLLINASIQFVLLLLILYGILKNKRILAPLFVTDLLLNFLLCTPFYMVSSYPVSSVNKMLGYVRGFPVQTVAPSAVAAEYTDSLGNTWRNTNTFRKEVSQGVSMPGPVILAPVGKFLSGEGIQKFRDKPLVCLDRAFVPGDSIHVLKQKPGRVDVRLSLREPGLVLLQQSYFPGWKAIYNGKRMSLAREPYPFVAVYLPEGSGELSFRFEKPGLTLAAIALHLFILSFLVAWIIRKLKIRSSSLS